MSRNLRIQGAPTSSWNGFVNWAKTEWADEEKYSSNMKLARAAGVFFGSVVLFACYGDVMAV